MHRLQGKLDRDGAVVNVLIATIEAEEKSLRKEGDLVPAQFPTTALIDTGASQTAVAPFVVEYLRLVQSGSVHVLVPGKSGTMVAEIHRVYNLAISLPAHPQFSHKVVAVAAMPATPGVSVLIGRDILDQCRFLFDGPKRRFTLWF